MSLSGHTDFLTKGHRISNALSSRVTKEGFCHSLIGVDFPSGLQSLTVRLQVDECRSLDLDVTKKHIDFMNSTICLFCDRNEIELVC